MLSFWQNIPLHLDPIAFSIGFFAIRWYALFFLLAFFAALLFCMKRVKKEGQWLQREEVFDLSFVLFFGALIGGRLGFALFYEPAYFLAHPALLFLPYDAESHTWTGISGMSFHGGLIGTAIALLGFAFKRKKDLWRLADLVSLSLSLALFFGRLGNFFNGELYGRLTEKPWGMFFFDGMGINFRHPSALYEAIFEGLFLFCILFYSRKYLSFPGGLSALFLMMYAALRFCVEFLREPDAGTLLTLSLFTRGQVLSLGMFLIGLFLFLWLKRRDHGKISSKA